MMNSASRRRTATVGSAVFFLAGPGIVIGLIPWLLTGWDAEDPMPVWAPWPVRALGVALIVAGAAVMVHAFVRFVADGLGTPFPADPPRHLVVTGLYRYVRNPMYVAIVAATLGQALLLGSYALLGYVVLAWAVTAVFVRFREEPALDRRFGPEYRTYRGAVRAWWPRLRPWDPAVLGDHRITAEPGAFG
jgi:protein-S-isoprenylcysteine O-methyltransferase Ste14